MRTRVSRFVTAMAESRPCGEVLGGGGGAVYLSFPGGVVALTSALIPAMPNGIVVAPGGLLNVRPPLDVSLSPGRLRVGRATVKWGLVDSYDLVVPVGSKVLPPLPKIAPPSDPVLRTTTTELAAALTAQDGDAAASAAGSMLGRGPGLTPMGDDLVVGAMAAAHALGIPADVMASALPKDLHSRTTSLSATLLQLAAGGRVVKPLLSVLSEDGGDLGSAARALVRVGSSTGGCLLRGVSAVLEAHRYRVNKEMDPVHRREEVA